MEGITTTTDHAANSLESTADTGATVQATSSNEPLETQEAPETRSAKATDDNETVNGSVTANADAPAKDSDKHHAGQEDHAHTVDDGEDDDDDCLPRHILSSAVFRPQLEDIVLDQDLLEFYEQLKFLISLSPLKTAQVLYAFSSATEHLSLELEVRRSVLDMNRKAFSFYQDNTWFTVDLEPALDLHDNSDGGDDDEAYESSDAKFKILPARHSLFPAFQRQKPGHHSYASAYHPPYPYYYGGYPYPYPYSYPYPHEPAHYSQPTKPGQDPRGPSTHPESDIVTEQQRHRSKDRDRDRQSRVHRHAMKSSKRRHSRELESPSHVSRPSTMTEETRLLKRSRQDPDSPSLTNVVIETGGQSSMDPLSPRLASANADKDQDQDNKLSRQERRLERKKLKLAKKMRLQRAEEQQKGSMIGERSRETGGGVEGVINPPRGRPFKITLVQSGKPLSSSGQSSTLDSAGGYERPKPLHGWIPLTDQGDGEGNAHTAGGHRTIRPSSDGKGSMGAGSDVTAKSLSQKPGILVTQLLGPHTSKKSKHLTQASPIQSASSNGGPPSPQQGTPTSAQGSAPASGPGSALYTDKSEDKLKKGTWTTAEEEILLEAVRELSNENWHAVAMKVPGRNAKQCMQKWQTDLDPQINRLPWTPEEDEKLVEAYHTFGNSWQQIAKMVETRTWYQCYNRVRAKSVKTKILLSASSHPASIANLGGAPGAGGGGGRGNDGPGGSHRSVNKNAEVIRIGKEPPQGRGSPGIPLVGPSGEVHGQDQRLQMHLIQTPAPAMGASGEKSVHGSPMMSNSGSQYPQLAPITGRQQEISFSMIPQDIGQNRLYLQALALKALRRIIECLSSMDRISSSSLSNRSNVLR
ncbi:hypothetical protein BGZ58_009533 [Dissophora ornata]|nr:hypothetical protein BGZ58_009533 [Dissophora ornata]